MGPTTTTTTNNKKKKKKKKNDVSSSERDPFGADVGADDGETMMTRMGFGDSCGTDGKRPIDARTKATALKGIESLPRDVQEAILDQARSDLVVGADRCQSMGCAKAATKRCTRCKVARYCSKTCQRKDWTERHRASCVETTKTTKTTKTKKTNASTSSGDVDGVINTMLGFNVDGGAPGALASSRVDPASFIENMEAGKSGGWYTGVPRERVYRRLVLSFALRVEDELNFCGNLVGALRWGWDGNLPLVPGDMHSSVMDEFRRYLARAKTNGVLPNDWTAEDEKNTLERAAAQNGIRCSYTKSDIVEKYGYASGEHMVLRSIAEHIIGRSCTVPGEWV
jgi:hypothetical protein